MAINNEPYMRLILDVHPFEAAKRKLLG